MSSCRTGRGWSIPLVCLWVCLVAGGCLPALPQNTDVGPPERSFDSQVDDVSFWTEPGLQDAAWVEIPAAGGRTITGYLSRDAGTNRSLLILLRGASTFMPDGSVEGTRQFLENRGKSYRDAGYRTFSLWFPECGSAYGQEDVALLLDLIDWLDAGGKTTLEVERTYVLGYSVGGTSALLANRQRQVTAVAAFSPVTEPSQFETNWGLYDLASQLYPGNEGFCQLGTTLATYGPPGSADWQVFDTVGHVRELKSPMLVIQGTQDQIYSIQNSRDLDAAYQQAVASGVSLPPVEFLYVQGADHFGPIDDPAVIAAVIAFFNQFNR